MKRFIPLGAALIIFSISSALAAQPAASSPSPAASASPAKHKHAKKAAATASVSPASAAAAASPSPKPKHGWLKKIGASASSSASPGAAAASSSGASPAAKHAMPVPSGSVAPGGGPGLVWVNTSTHVYHKQSSKWYGRTKDGKYMSEADAIKEGDHADKHDPQ